MTDCPPDTRFADKEATRLMREVEAADKESERYQAVIREMYHQVVDADSFGDAVYNLNNYLRSVGLGVVVLEHRTTIDCREEYIPGPVTAVYDSRNPETFTPCSRDNCCQGSLTVATCRLRRTQP